MICVGVVGCGYWGAKHVRNFHELPDSDLALVCDLDEARLRHVHNQYAYVSTSTNFGDVLADHIDAVVIATPVASHYRLAKEALLHGKHVLVEKPLTASSRQAAELIDIAEERNLMLMVGHTYEHHPAVNFLHDLINSGELGDVFYVDAARLNLGLFRSDVNVMWDLAPHDICIALKLLGGEPVSVGARGSSCIDPSVCDVAYIDLKFATGTTAHIHVSWLDPCKVRRITIVGSRKMVVYDDVSDSEKIRIYDKGIAMPEEGDTFGAWPPAYRYGDVTIPYIPNDEPLKLECSHFLTSIAEGSTPTSDGWSGLRVINVLEAANRSIVNGGQRESLPSVKERFRTSSAEVKCP
jgi:predicted dehydrogenase